MVLLQLLGFSTQGLSITWELETGEHLDIVRLVECFGTMETKACDVNMNKRGMH